MTSQVAVMRKAEKKPVSIERSTYWLALGLTLLSMLYLIVVQMTGATWLSFTDTNGESSQLTLALIECALGLAVIHIPNLAAKMLRVKLPDVLCTAFYFFIVCAVPLGEVFSFYYRISIWDSLLHFSSGIMLWMLGGLFLVNYLRKKKCDNLITPAFIGLVALMFAISLGVVWEFYEFTLDNLLGMNMQKALLEDGIPLVGKAALLDTMKDLIVDFLGGLTATFLLAPPLKHKKGWLYSFGSNKDSEKLRELTAGENRQSQSAQEIYH